MSFQNNKEREPQLRISFSHVSPNTSNVLITSKSPRLWRERFAFTLERFLLFGDFERKQEYKLTLLILFWGSYMLHRQIILVSRYDGLYSAKIHHQS